jgi:hypothetical protein
MARCGVKFGIEIPSRSVAGISCTSIQLHYRAAAELSSKAWWIIERLEQLRKSFHMSSGQYDSGMVSTAIVLYRGLRSNPDIATIFHT